MRARHRALLGLIALSACLAPSCFLTPKLVGVQPIGLDQAHAELNANALVADRLSDASRQVIAYFDLGDELDDDPRAALRALHAYAVTESRGPTVFALAELAYLVGKRRHDRAAFLSAAVYAQLFLLDERCGTPDPYDRRFRWAADIHNQGLLRAGIDAEDGTFALAPGRHALLVGHLEVSDAAADTFPWDARAFRFLPADAFRIQGLRLRLRDSGLGVALIGVDTGAPLESRVLARPHEVPVTAFLRVTSGLAELEAGGSAELELHNAYDSTELDVAGRRVPLETDRSAVLAHALDPPAVWRSSVTGFFRGDAERGKLMFAQPYQPGRVPVVFVHGTASSPAYWADLFNTLWFEPELRTGAQFWFFRYSTGNPIVYSAADLRDALLEALATLDPDGSDDALRDMVLVGHSQGGLLVRLVVSGGEPTWFEEMFPDPEASGATPDDLEILRRCLDFRPLPCVTRTVFVCTPHRGSFLSERFFAGLVARLISFPGEIAAATRRITSNEIRLPEELRPRDLTSVSAMDPDSPFIRRLQDSPIAPGVTTHSVIAIGDADPTDPEELAEADDGVVAYPSAHLDGVASETLVPASHSCQSHPVTVQAVREILLEHVRARPSARPAAE
jgi:hypothetical protein